MFKYKHIIVVHGIGEQAPNETALGFMNEFIRALPLRCEDDLLVNNLIESVDGLMSAKPGRARFQPANIAYRDAGGDVHVIGFSEVYWQPIARGFLAQNEGNLPVPIFTWARSIVNRLQGDSYKMAGWRAAIENLETMLELLDKLAKISRRSQVFVDLTKNFLGDVQMYAESDAIRQEINQKFFEVLRRVGDFQAETAAKMKADLESGDPVWRGFLGFELFHKSETYVVAHSEGTVVAYNSLVQAAMVLEGGGYHGQDEEFKRAGASYRRSGATEAESPDFTWLKRVAGLVTLGSPLDKHYWIWRSRFRKHRLKLTPERKIPWYNFYDFNDPVAYALTELHQPEAGVESPTDADKLFETAGRDFGFQRYPIPGKAHVDYWTDRGIHEWIIHMMGLRSQAPGPLTNGWWSRFLRPIAAILYVGIRGVTIAAGLFFANRLLHVLPLDAVLAWAPLGRVHGFFMTQPLGGGQAWLNYLVWLVAPLVLMKTFAELEMGWMFDREVWPSVRVVLAGLWVVVAFILCLYVNPVVQGGSAGGGLSDLLGYGVGLVVSVLAWRLHTTIHRGLMQLWAYTMDE